MKWENWQQPTVSCGAGKEMKELQSLEGHFVASRLVMGKVIGLMACVNSSSKPNWE
jgi:hypothetical protein